MHRNIGLWLIHYCTICFDNPESVIHLLKGVYVNYVIYPSHADHKSHIIHCRWATKDEPFELNVSNINIIVKDVAMYEHNLHCIYKCEYVCEKLYIVHNY